MANTSDHNPAQEADAEAPQGPVAPLITPDEAAKNGDARDGKDPDVFLEEALRPDELEDFEDMNTLTLEAAEGPITGTEDDSEDEEEDLLSTLEMPVFRLPGALNPGRAASKTTPDEAPVEKGEDGRPIPLSGILRGRRKLIGLRNDQEENSAPLLSLLPFVVARQPVGYEKHWHDGLPNGEAKRRQDHSEASKPAPPSPPPAIKASAELPALTAEALASASFDEDEDSLGGPTAPIPGVTDEMVEEAQKTVKVQAAAAPPPEPPPPVQKAAAPPPAQKAPAEPPRPAAKPPGKPVAVQAQAPPQNKDELSDIVQELIDESERPAPARGKKTSQQPPPERAWYDQIFTEEYFRTLPMGFHRQTRREAQFILGRLSVGHGGRILDLSCGFGRHTIEMAKRGYDMVGLDLSLPLLQKALNEAQRRKLSIKFIHGDVRELNFNGVFDAAFCFHTSFGYFDDKTNFKVLQGVHQALKPGGRFLLEVINRDYIIQQLPRRKWWEGSDCLFLEEVSFNYKTSVLHNKRTFIYDDNRPPWEQYIYIRLFSLHELQSLLRLAGFNVLEVSGSINCKGAFFGADSPQLLVLSEKTRA